MRILLFLLTFFITTFAYADKTADDLTQLLNSVKAMRANFTQTIYDSKGKKVQQQSSGRMALERPGKFRWDIVKPIPQLIIANKTRLWIYDPDLEQVTIRSLEKAAGEVPALLLSQENSVLEKDFSITEPKQKSDERFFQLVPKSKDNMFAKINIVFANDKLKEMHLIDHLGHVTKIVFHEPKTNVALSDSLFNFKTPPKIDVIDETKRGKK